MRCIILADDPGWEVLFEDNEAFVELHTVSTGDEFRQAEGEAHFDFRDEAWDTSCWPLENNRPVFVSGVTGTLTAHLAPENIIRINAWPGMLKRPLMECVAGENIRPAAELILGSLARKAKWLPDTPGMVSPRVLSMIINEAWYAWGEWVSSKTDIDTAMQLGTNYPLGPFAWGEKIGLHRVCRLLSVLSEENDRYSIAPALSKEVGL